MQQQATIGSEFKVGDKAVYPAQGVAEVISIEELDIAGLRQRFYVLRILDTDRRIKVPVKNAQSVGLRQVICEEEIERSSRFCGNARSRSTIRLGTAATVVSWTRSRPAASTTSPK